MTESRLKEGSSAESKVKKEPSKRSKATPDFSAAKSSKGYDWNRRGRGASSRPVLKKAGGDILPEKIKGNTYRVTIGYTDVGMYMLNNKEAVLIDSGSVESMEFVEYLKGAGIEIKAILHTHLHLDHISCDNILQEIFKCRSFTSQEELEHNRKMQYDDISENLRPKQKAGTFTAFGAAFEIFASQGHTDGHQCIVTPDGVCCLGDTMMSMSKLRHSKVPYHHDIAAALKTMKMISKMGNDYDCFLAAHNGVIKGSEIKDVASANIAKERELQEMILEIAEKPVTMDDAELLFMKRAGVVNKETMKLRWMHKSARTRIMDLIRRELLTAKGGMIVKA